MVINKKPSPLQLILLVVIISFMVWFLLPQLGTIIFTALMAYTFYPLYVRMRKRIGLGAAPVTLIASFLIVIVPLVFVSISAVQQLFVFAEVAGSTGYWQQLTDAVTEFMYWVNVTLTPVTGYMQYNDAGLVELLRTQLPEIARAGARFLLGVLGNLPQLSIGFIIYIYVFISLLHKGPQLIVKIKQLIPLPATSINTIFEKMGLMATAMMKGQLIMSMITSFVSALLLIPLGYGNLFFILFVLFTVLNFVPLGCGIVLVPLAAYSMMTGQFWQGLVVIVLYYALGNLDPLMRSRLIPKKVYLSATLMMIATFCGIAYFGILGIVYGPILAILLLTLIDLYLEYTSVKRST